MEYKENEMKFKKILSIGISESQLDKWCWKKIDSLAEKRVSLSEDSKQIDKQLADADCLLVTFNKADKQMIDKAPNLKYIGALATGVGKIDTNYAASKSIVVTNIPGYSTESVAEFVFAVLLERLRDISRAKIESKQKRTSENNFSGREIKGKKFGVIGLGRIGTRVSHLAKCFGADVLYWSRNRKLQEEKDGIKYAKLSDLLRNCDIISLHLALNKGTENILNQANIKKIKNGAIFINTAPLELLDINTLETRLKNKDITFIFDHTDPGDITDENLAMLRQHDNCITYPVLGYISDEARMAKQDIFTKNIENFLKGAPINLVIPT